MEKIDLKTIFEPRNRGILLDVVVFFISLVLIQILTIYSQKLAYQAETEVFAKLLVGLFFVGVFFLQPIGPVLKRWSFHKRVEFDNDSLAGCLIFWFMWFYLVMMIMISGTAVIILQDVFFEKGSPAADIGTGLILGGFVISIVNTVLIIRYFRKPKKKPRWEFLTTPQAAWLGDLFMFLNVICLQILWNCLTAATSFWNHIISTPLGKPGSLTDIFGRFIVIGTLALLVYFPARIFYLAEDKNRKITWVTMLLANLPLIFRAIVASRRP